MLSPEVSIIIPAYNEEQGIGKTLQSLCETDCLSKAEIIVINDGSHDGTREIVEGFPNVQLINHITNRGYGVSIVSGIKRAAGEYIVWFDADGQHRLEDLLLIIKTLREQRLDYCIGVRDSRSHAVHSRKLGKLILKQAVRIVAGRPVGDYNSGLRGFRRAVIARYVHLFPKGFSASTTSTLIMYERGYVGAEVPIIVNERAGKSSVNQIRDGIRTLVMILRLFLLFKPLHFFGTIGAVLILAGTVYGLSEAYTNQRGFPVFGALVVILGVQTLFFGLLADQISAVRREKFE